MLQSFVGLSRIDFERAACHDVTCWMFCCPVGQITSPLPAFLQSFPQLASEKADFGRYVLCVKHGSMQTDMYIAGMTAISNKARALSTC